MSVLTSNIQRTGNTNFRKLTVTKLAVSLTVLAVSTGSTVEGLQMNRKDLRLSLNRKDHDQHMQIQRPNDLRRPTNLTLQVPRNPVQGQGGQLKFNNDLEGDQAPAPKFKKRDMKGQNRRVPMRLELPINLNSVEIHPADNPGMLKNQISLNSKYHI
jgi:hypothetical protein